VSDATKRLIDRRKNLCRNGLIIINV